MTTVQENVIEFGKVRTTCLGDRVHTRDRYHSGIGLVRHITIECPEDTENDRPIQHGNPGTRRYD